MSLSAEPQSPARNLDLGVGFVQVQGPAEGTLVYDLAAAAAGRTR